MAVVDKKKNLQEITEWLVATKSHLQYCNDSRYPIINSNIKSRFYFDPDTKERKLEVIGWIGLLLAVYFLFLNPASGVRVDNAPFLFELFVVGFLHLFIWVLLGMVFVAVGGIIYWVTKDEDLLYKLTSPVNYYSKKKKHDAEKKEKEISKEKESKRYSKIIKYLDDIYNQPDAEEIFSSVTLDDIKKIVDNV